MAGITAEKIDILVGFNNKLALRGISLLDKKLKGLKKPVDNANRLFGKMFKIAGFAGFTKMALDAGKFGRAMGLLADKTGIASEKISEMRNAFAATGGAAEDIDNLLNSLSTGLARLSMGDGKLASVLSSMGINAWDEFGRKTPDVLYKEIADWAHQQKQMGRSLADVQVFLKDNLNVSEDIARDMYNLGYGGMKARDLEKTKKIGKISQENINRLEELNQKWSEFSTSLVVSFKNIVAYIEPFMEKVLDFARGIAKFVGENPQIGAVVAGVLGLSTALSTLGVALKGVGFILTALLAHPLIAMAIASGYAGKKLAETDTAADLVAGTMSGIDKRMFATIDKQEKTGKISHEMANELRKRLGSGSKDILFTPKTYEVIYQYEDDILNGNEAMLANDDAENEPIVNLEQTLIVNKDGTVNTETSSDSGSFNVTKMLMPNMVGGAK